MVVTSKVIMRRANVRFNYHDYLQLPEDKRYEILDGELCVVPAPNVKHQRVSRNLEMALHQFLKASELGEVFNAPFDVVLSEENIVQPDILFIRKEHYRIICEANVRGTPDLVVEILSKGTRAKDTGMKKKTYARFGVQEYWIVDPESETVEVLLWNESGYVSAGICGKSGRLSSPLFPDLNLPLSEIFQ
jgi:Uma2 family endonuclease